MTTHTKKITTVDIGDDTIAILAGTDKGARWEVYTVVDGLEVFSHFATDGEARQLSERVWGADMVSFAARSSRDAVHFGIGGWAP